MLKIKEQPEFNQASSETELTDKTKFLWIRAPKTIVYNSNFSDGAKLLYLILLDYQGRNSYAFPSLETLAKDMGKSIRRVQQLIKELEDGAAIEVISQPGWVNLYRVCQVESEADSSQIVTIESEPNSDTNQADAKVSTPMQKVSPLPMQKTSSELDSAKLDSKIVCEKSRITPLQPFTHKGQVQTLAGGQQPKPKPAIELTLSPTQNEIATLLQNAGVASVDALRIASTNPAKPDVLRWIDLAQSKANPGGYLAVVLGKLQVAPPEKKTSQQEQSIRSKKWQKRDNDKVAKREAGALAFMRRHANELEKWQQDVIATDVPTLASAPAVLNSTSHTELDTLSLGTITNEENVIPIVDPAIRALVRQIDKQACGYLRQAHIVDDCLLLSFVGNYRPSSSFASWLPAVKSKYPTVKEIVLL